MKIIYVHHALRDLGNPPTQQDGLKQLGIKDAKIVAKLFEQMTKYFHIKAIYTSPYYRCAKTAEIINKYIKVPVYEEPRFNEFKKVYEIEENGQTVIKTETWLQCQQRIRDAIKNIVENYDKKDAVICVTSGVNITAFIELAFKINPSEEAPYPIVPSCSPIGFEINETCF